MRRPKIIVVGTSGLVAAIALGYFGVQLLGKNIMYAISGGTIGLGVGTLGIQVLEKKNVRQRKRE